MADARTRDAPVPQRAIDFLTKKVKAKTERWDDLSPNSA
jgi:hypothetical protein